MMVLSETDFLQKHTRSEDSYRSGIFKKCFQEKPRRGWGGWT